MNMKNQIYQLSQEVHSEMNAKRAIEVITKWVEERYPVLSDVSKSRLITQCLIEIREERRNLSSLN
jgi:hypothetical protein